MNTNRFVSRKPITYRTAILIVIGIHVAFFVGFTEISKLRSSWRRAEREKILAKKLNENNSNAWPQKNTIPIVVAVSKPAPSQKTISNEPVENTTILDKIKEIANSISAAAQSAYIAFNQAVPQKITASVDRPRPTPKQRTTQLSTNKITTTSKLTNKITTTSKSTNKITTTSKSTNNSLNKKLQFLNSQIQTTIAAASKLTPSVPRQQKILLDVPTIDRSIKAVFKPTLTPTVIYSNVTNNTSVPPQMDELIRTESRVREKIASSQEYFSTPVYTYNSSTPVAPQKFYYSTQTYSYRNKDL